MSTRRVSWRLAAAVLVALAVTAGGYAVAAGGDDGSAEAYGPGSDTVLLEIDDSRFSTDRIVVRPGTDLRFVVVNDDPINHELIVGGPEVHERHQDGQEKEHPPVPGEVSVGPDEIVTTTYHFHDPGTVTFACHLPGHLAYGMVGEIVVEEE